MFDIQHHERSGSDTIGNRHAPRPRPTNGFDSIYTWGGSAPGRPRSMEFGGPVQSGSGRFGSCLHYEVIRTSSSCVDPER